MSTGKRSIKLLVVLLFFYLAAHAALAQAQSPVDGERIAKLEAAVSDAKSSADNSWMLTSSALVLLMTGPGLALFYGGLVRRKNVLATMMQSFTMMAVVTVLWAIIGYSLAFGSGTSFIGGFQHFFLSGVARPQIQLTPGRSRTRRS